VKKKKKKRRKKTPDAQPIGTEMEGALQPRSSRPSLAEGKG
jgi:hypothetical protein